MSQRKFYKLFELANVISEIEDYYSDERTTENNIFSSFQKNHSSSSDEE